MKRLLATLFVLLCGIVVSHAAVDTVKFTTRSNSGGQNGPPKDWTSVRVTSEVDAGGSLKIRAVTDSTDAGVIFMELIVPKFTTKSVGVINLGLSTIWKYGNSTGQISVLQTGKITLSEIDPTSNRLRGTFEWTGRATPGAITLTTYFTNGYISITRTPKLAHDIFPKAGVKWKPESEHKFTVITKRNGGNEPVPNADVTLKMPPGIFEDTQLSKTSDANGRAEWNLKLKKSAEGGKYEIQVSSKKTGYDDSEVDKWEFHVDTTLRYYYSKCAGIPIVEFDAGEGKKWTGDGGTVIEAEGDIKINGVLNFTGSMKIDTVGAGAKITGVGQLWLESVEVDGSQEKFVFYDGPIVIPPVSCDGVLDISQYPWVKKVAGNVLKEAKLKLLGDFGASAGLSASVKLEGPRNVADGCDGEVPVGTIYRPNTAKGFAIEASFIKPLPLADNKPLKFSVVGKASDIAIGPSICMKEVSLGYDSEKSEFSMAAKGKSPLFEEVAASVVFKNGTLNNFAGSFKLDKCVPIPETPMCFKGGGVSVENLFIGNPFKASINSIMQVIGKEDLLELEFTGELISPPNSIRAGGTVRFLKVAQVSEDKPWQAEGGIGFTLTLDESSITMDGTIKILHFGGDHFFSGSYKGTMGFLPDFSINQTLDGSLKFPAIPEDKAPGLGILGKMINKCAPVDIGAADGALVYNLRGERSLTINYNLENLGGQCAPEALKQLGKGSLYVDFLKLPSPSAVVFDGALFDILSGWGGRVQDVASGKAGEQVQAASATFNVGPNEKMLVAMSETTVPPADITLKTPSGTVLTAADPSNGIYKSLSADGEIVMWVVKNPAAGSWTIEQPQGRTSDSIMVSVSRIADDLAVQATQTGDALQVSWNAQSYSSDATIMVFADANDSNLAGRPIFEGPANVSPVTITLTDTTAPCTFHVHASVTGRGVARTAQAEGAFSNAKESLLPPQNITAISNDAGVAGIRWDEILNPNVRGVVVYRTDGGRMDVVTSAYNYETEFNFDLPQPTGAVLRMASVDGKGRMGCLSDPVSVTVDVQEEVYEGNGLTMWLAPNPASDQVSVRTDNATGTVTYKLINMMGSVVLELGGDNERTTLDLSSLTSGSYVLVAQIGEKHVASTLQIVR